MPEPLVIVTVLPTRVQTPVGVTVTGKPEEAVGLILNDVPYWAEPGALNVIVWFRLITFKVKFCVAFGAIPLLAVTLKL